jgi:hypothetical protein
MSFVGYVKIGSGKCADSKAVKRRVVVVSGFSIRGRDMYFRIKDLLVAAERTGSNLLDWFQNRDPRPGFSRTRFGPALIPIYTRDVRVDFRNDDFRER